jgi:hypothetical protein
MLALASRPASSYAIATIEGKALCMSPGAKIYNEHNPLIMPAAMRQQAAVLYRLDTAARLSAIWLLTPQEAAAHAPESKRRPKPADQLQAPPAGKPQ